MKGRKILAFLTGFSILTAGACSCGDETQSSGEDSFVRGEEIEFTPTVSERYVNQRDIEGQWGPNNWTGGKDYGIGDPFVMRWNGKYYMYPSTNDAFKGVKVFVSDDMINWTYAGLAVADTEATSHGSYAPEVVYYDGYFYMCQSRAGKGHYIYRSKSPTEGFELISKNPSLDESDLDYGNMGMGIDGTFYVSDDGKLYILHTVTPAGLQYNEITDVNNISPSTITRAKTVREANLGHWIEGPGVIRRGAYSYLTYCGNHVNSRGYRIGYSYAENLSSLSDFIQPLDNITIIDTSAGHYGLGHSSNVNGPDLDSIYTAYHSFVSGGPCRRYNVDRYFASGSLLTANGATYRPVAAPVRATKEAKNGSELTLNNGTYALGESAGYFTAEFNLIPSQSQEIRFGGGYTVGFGNNSLTLSYKGSQIASASVNYTQGNLVTVRVENGDGVGYIYLNGMRVITYTAQSAPGLVGYLSDEGVEYTAFTNDVFGTSDFEAIKNFSTRFPATSYLKGENRGFSIRNAQAVKGGLRVGEKQSIKVSANAENAVCLGEGDWIKYAVDIGESGLYSLSARILSTSSARLKITIGDSVHTVDLPNAENCNISLGNMQLTQAVTTMKVEVVSGSAEFIWFDVQAEASGNSSQSLESFEKLRGSVTYSNGELILTSANKAGDDAVAVWGGRGMSNYQVEFTYVADSQSLEMGFMIRSNDYSYHSAQASNPWRGYYLKMTSQLMAFYRHDYGASLISASRQLDLFNGNEHHIKVVALSNTFKIYLDGELAFECSDENAFTYGKVGLYVSEGTITVKNFKFEQI